MDLAGVVGHVVQGTKILLQCTVRAARPAANITWQNGTEYLNASDRFDMFETKVEENVSTTENYKIFIPLSFTFNDYGIYLNIIAICICNITFIIIPLEK